MLDRKGLDAQRTDVERFAWRNKPTVGDRITVYQLPCRPRRIDRAWGTLRKPVSVVAVRVRQQNGVGSYCRDAVEPVSAAIDQQPGVILCHKEGTVPAVSPALLIDFAARTEEQNLHRRKPTIDRRLLVSFDLGQGRNNREMLVPPPPRRRRIWRVACRQEPIERGLFPRARGAI